MENLIATPTVSNERTRLLQQQREEEQRVQSGPLIVDGVVPAPPPQPRYIINNPCGSYGAARLTRSPSYRRRVPARRKKPTPHHWRYYLAQYSIALLVSCLVVVIEYRPPELHSYYNNHGGRRVAQRQFHSFPEDFVWGAATSAYQIEGGSEERGTSIWDTFAESHPENILDGTNGDVACDHYHKMEEDVQLMKSLGLQAYRFSIAWTRILPNGKGEINMEGIEFYNRLIDSLLEAGITPYITLFHWDLPQALQDEYGGWLDRRIIHDFAMYAKLCFHHFGDRVQHWITLNESWTVAVNGYNNHIHAPGHSRHPGTETYLAAHHLLLAHATAVQVFREENYDGVIGISNCADYRYPADKSNTADNEAAQRAMVFQLAWFADPIWFGDYPSEMKQRLGSRLPRFTRNERRMLKGSSDFFGLNHYSSLLAAEPAEKHASYEGYWADMHVDFSTRDKWKHNDMGWSIVPSGCRELLLWISHRYDKPIIIMTENGSAEPEDDLEMALQDEGRRQYFEKYLRASAEAIETGDVDMRGYFAWSLMDNYEWQFGYQRRFGICYVDFETQEQTPKSSATWYAQTIAANGHNIRRKEFNFLE